MTADDPEEVQEFVAENRDLLGRMLAHGDTEARGYALALLANGGKTDDFEQVQREFDKLRDADEE
ncbi:hypothetical protein [Halococcus agarilyticus]|uniref:hypothetical protein n=1 Tax=Halococcus agarilyticus TaxID=1232219 RepID=UPI000677E715|nr:hypothetical protein [Halococcus agarilyticus]